LVSCLNGAKAVVPASCRQAVPPWLFGIVVTPRLSSYHLASLSGSFARKKNPPIPVTFSIASSPCALRPIAPAAALAAAKVSAPRRVRSLIGISHPPSRTRGHHRVPEFSLEQSQALAGSAFGLRKIAAEISAITTPTGKISRNVMGIRNNGLA